MSGTLASLIRQYQLHPKTTRAAPETDRVSAPGRYDKTGSQKSPYLDRIIEKEAAKKVGEDMGFDPKDLEDIEGFKDLQDLIDDKKTDPDYPTEHPDPKLPLNPDLPTPEPPTEPKPPVTPPNEIDGLRVYVLHNSSISYSNDGGATFRDFDAPIGAHGFVVVSNGIYVATNGGVYFSSNLQSWTELSIPGDPQPLGGFQNGSFESGLSGWELHSGYEPTTGNVESEGFLATHGDAFLMRSWIVFSNGGFEIRQTVELSSDERAAIANGAQLRLSADIATDGGATATVGLVGQGNVSGMSGDSIVAASQTSDPLDSIEVSGIGGAPAGEGIFRFIYYSRKDVEESTIINEIRLGVELEIGGHVYSHPPISQTNVDRAAGNVRSSQINRVVTAILTSPTGPGSFAVLLPVGWRLPDPGPSNSGYPRMWNFTAFGPMLLTAPSVTVASVSGGHSGWQEYATSVGLAPISSLTVSVQGSGTPADVFIDNIRLELLLPSSGSADVTAIGRAGSGAQAAVNGALYNLSPGGMSYTRSLNFDPEAIEDGAVFGGDSIIIGGEQLDAPGSIAQYLGGGVIVTNGGDIYQRAGDDWTSLSSVPSGSRVLSAFNGHIAFGEDGSLRVARTLAGPWSSGPSLPGGYSGTRGFLKSGRRTLVYVEGKSVVWWLDSNAWRMGGAAPAGILDIDG